MIADYNYIYIYISISISIYIYIYIYVYIYILYIYILYIYYIDSIDTIYIDYIYYIDTKYIYYMYIVIVCNHEITHTSCAICRDKFLAFLYQQKFTKLYWAFNYNMWSNAWILNKMNKRAKIVNKINSIS